MGADLVAVGEPVCVGVVVGRVGAVGVDLIAIGEAVVVGSVSGPSVPALTSSPSERPSSSRSESGSVPSPISTPSVQPSLSESSSRGSVPWVPTSSPSVSPSLSESSSRGSGPRPPRRRRARRCRSHRRAGRCPARSRRRRCNRRRRSPRRGDRACGDLTPSERPSSSESSRSVPAVTSSPSGIRPRRVSDEQVGARGDLVVGEPIAVGVVIVSVRAHLDAVGEAVVVGVGVEVGPGGHLVAVGAAVVIGVGVEGVGARAHLAAIGESVVVGVGVEGVGPRGTSSPSVHPSPSESPTSGLVPGRTLAVGEASSSESGSRVGARGDLLAVGEAVVSESGSGGRCLL